MERAGYSRADEAVSALKMAIRLDELRKYEEALPYYQIGLEALIDQLRNEVREEAKRNLQKQVEQYMARAETVKALVLEEKHAINSRGGSSGEQKTGTDSSLARARKYASDKARKLGITRANEISPPPPPSSTQTQNVCPTGHSLTITERREEWICDICDVKYEAGIVSNRCATCDYDACTTCFKPRPQKKRASLPSPKLPTPTPTGPAPAANPNRRRPVSLGGGPRRAQSMNNPAPKKTGSQRRPGGPSISPTGTGSARRKLPAQPSPARAANPMETLIMEELLDQSPGVTWDSIAGLEYAKGTLQETVVFPNLRPDLFTGLRAPPKGVLLFGPPGTGKTLLAKAVASETDFTFFSISASSLVSKYLGEGEKLVRALFTVARRLQPSIIFMDEIDSMLGKRKENEHEASRRLKTEFMVQLDGAGSSSEDRILVMGATNLPQSLDEAVLRRLPKRIYIPLPDEVARRYLINKLMEDQKHSLRDSEMDKLVRDTEGYSCSDLTAVCKEAAIQPLRDLGSRIRTIQPKDIRQINFKDFEAALSRIRPSVSEESLEVYSAWDRDFGSH